MALIWHMNSKGAGPHSLLTTVPKSSECIHQSSLLRFSELWASLAAKILGFSPCRLLLSASAGGGLGDVCSGSELYPPFWAGRQARGGPCLLPCPE